MPTQSSMHVKALVHQVQKGYEPKQSNPFTCMFVISFEKKNIFFMWEPFIFIELFHNLEIPWFFWWLLIQLISGNNKIMHVQNIL